jgi:hypothetical protein
LISTAYYVTRSAGESVFILILNLMLRNINVQSIRALNLLIFNSVVIECVLLSLLQSIRALNLLIFTSVVIVCVLLSLFPVLLYLRYSVRASFVFAPLVSSNSSCFTTCYIALSCDRAVWSVKNTLIDYNILLHTGSIYIT